MDNYLKKQLYHWVFHKIKSNPKKFGGDFSNPLIMMEYLKKFYSSYYIYELELELMSILTTVSRIKNRILKKYPHLDFRVKYKKKKKWNTPYNEV